MHVFATEVRETARGRHRKVRPDFERNDIPGELRKYRGAIPRPGPDFEDVVPRSRVGRLHHLGNHRGLRDRLVVSDGEGYVLIGAVLQLAWNEILAGNLVHGFDDAPVAQAFGLQLGEQSGFS